MYQHLPFSYLGLFGSGGTIKEGGPPCILLAKPQGVPGYQMKRSHPVSEGAFVTYLDRLPPAVPSRMAIGEVG